MTWILLLICLAVGGRELYTAYERRQASRRAADDKAVIEGLAVRIAALEGLTGRIAALEDLAAQATPLEDLAARITALEDTAAQATALEDLAARITSLETSLTEAEARREDERAAAERDGGRLAALEEGQAEVAAAVADLHRDQVVRLEQEIARGTALRGLLRGDASDGRVLLSEAYGRCLSAYGLHVQAARRTVRGTAWSESYHLSGDGLAWLPRVLLGKAKAGDDEALRDLLAVLASTPGGLVRIGTFAAVRTPAGLLFGVTPDSGSPATDHPDELAEQLRSLPPDDRSSLDSD
jgi:hypothetical protein